MNNRTKILIYPIATLLIFVTAFFALVFPRFRAVSKVRSQMDYYKGIVDSSTLTIADLAQIEEKVAGTRKELANVEMKLPKVSNFAKVIEEIAQLSSKFKITVNTISPIIADVKIQGEKRFIRKRYIEMNIKCKYQVFGRFLEAINQLPTLFSVEDFIIDRDDDMYPELKVILLLSVYMVED